MDTIIWIAVVVVLLGILGLGGYLIYLFLTRTKEDLSGKFNGMVEKINDSNLYAYQFDKQQEANIKNLETNMNTMFNNYAHLKNDVLTMKSGVIRKGDLAKEIKTDRVSAGEMQVGIFSFSSLAPNASGNKGSASGDNWLYMYRGGVFDGGLGVKHINSKVTTSDRAHIGDLYVKGDTQLNKGMKLGDNKWQLQVDAANKLQIAPVTDISKQVFIDKTGYLGALGGGLSARGGKSRHNPSKLATQFPSSLDDKNYVRGDTELTGDLDVVGRINVTRKNPGAMLQRSNGSYADRYGIGQYEEGKLRVYGASTPGASVNLSLAKAKGEFDDVVEVHSDKSVTINGRTDFKSGLCIGSTCLREYKGALQACNKTYTDCKSIA